MTRSYSLRGAADLSRRQALAGDPVGVVHQYVSVIGSWSFTYPFHSKGRAGSHGLNCPITIVVRLSGWSTV